MDAMSKELEAWNLTSLVVLATHINLMLRKYFSALLMFLDRHCQIVNVICKFLSYMWKKIKCDTFETFQRFASHFNVFEFKSGVALISFPLSKFAWKNLIINNFIRFDGKSVTYSGSTTFEHGSIYHLGKYLGQPFTTGGSNAKTEIMRLESGEWKSGPDYPFHSL